MQRIFPAYSRSLISETISRKFSLAKLAQVFTLPRPAGLLLLSVKNTQRRQFYETGALREGWSVRRLDPQISSQFCERHCPEIRPRCWQSFSHSPRCWGDRNLSAGSNDRPVLIGEISTVRSFAHQHRDAHIALRHSTLAQQFCPDLDASAR